MTPDPSAEIRDLARGVRAISCAFAFVVCYFNVLLSFKIGKFEEICADMLGGKPLPVATAFLFEARWYFVALALALPICALLAVCLLRSHRIALTLAGGVLVVAFLQMHFTWSALMAPLLGVISGLQANG